MYKRQIQPWIQEKRQSLEVEVSGLKAECFLGDRLRLRQILINLLSNAVTYTQEGGQIQLTVLGLPEISKGYAHLCFQVQDNGIGISPEFIKNIFDHFTREKDTTASGILGVGLGMAITKNLVDLMGGTISVQSTQGRGSTFRVELELRYPDAQPVETGSREQTRLPASGDKPLEGLRMLVAEDNDINSEILEELLSCEGVSCERTGNGQEALERFRQMPPGTFAAVLMDIQMPVMDGFEATRRIRALSEPALSHIPIIAMTANAFDEDRRAAARCGMNGFISKPIDTEELLRTLHQIFG